MSTTAQLITQVAIAVKDPSAHIRGRDTLLVILNDQHDYIIEQTECLRKIDTSLILIADQREYDLPVDFIKFPIESADYKKGFIQVGTNAKFLIELRSQPFLHSRYPGWLSADSGTPQYAYIERQGVMKIGFHPKPSAAFIAVNGTTVYLDKIYRPTALADDANQPFENSVSLRGLQFLLKLLAIWQIKLEDMQFNDVDRLEQKIDARMEEAKEVVQSIYSIPGESGFGDNASQY